MSLKMYAKNENITPKSEIEAVVIKSVSEQKATFVPEHGYAPVKFSGTEIENTIAWSSKGNLKIRQGEK